MRYIKNISVTNNKEIIAQNDSLSLKLLGFLGDKVIISSLDNKRLIIINESEVVSIELKRKEKSSFWLWYY